MNDLIITVSCLVERGKSGIESNVSLLRFNQSMNHLQSHDEEFYIGASEIPVRHIQFTGTPEEIKKAVSSYVDDILLKATSSL